MVGAGSLAPTIYIDYTLRRWNNPRLTSRITAPTTATKQAGQVEARHALSAKRLNHKTADQCADDADDDVGQAAHLVVNFPQS